MKIALAQLNYHIGNFHSNESKIIDSIQKAIAEKVDLIVFSELAICGYPPRDFLEFEDFISNCEESLIRIAKHCTNISAIVGSPSRTNNKKGKKLYNSAFLLQDGGISDCYNKQLLPTYDIFDENRYFESGKEAHCIDVKGKKIALTICEDLWNIKGSYLYSGSPMEELITESPDLIINIAASPFSVNQEKHREKTFQYNINKYKTPIIYVNHIGAQTELIFDGNSRIINSKGETTAKLSSFNEDFKTVEYSEFDVIQQPIVNFSDLEKIESAITLGIKDYFRKLNFKKATLGLSGGIDSALTLVLAVKALGAENVKPILMPSQFSSDHSISDSIALCNNLGCEYHEIAIESIFEEFNSNLASIFKGTSFDLTEENIQSRIRGTLLMAYTNKFGAILLNTSNKSELAVGYGTLYGDMAGGISVLGDLYKTEVFDLSWHINKEKEVIPTNIITKPPSAELRPDQKDSDSLPDYDDLDRILKLYIEECLSPSNIIDLGNEEELVRRTIKMVNINEYKRYQAPPIIRISDKAFGMGRRMPIVGKYLS
jgi:NAD+ synthase (glutamine-hydrolysing)